MNDAIEQKVEFVNASAEELFDIYLDPKKHSSLHGGAQTKISNKEGDTFSLLNGNLTGKNLLIIPNRMVVQSWRGNVWGDKDLDSILTLVFSNTPHGASIQMVHCFTPNQFTEMWEEIYWNPVNKYLKENRR